eukprot:gene7618-11941_t
MFSSYPISVKELNYYPDVLSPQEINLEPTEIIKKTKFCDATATGKIKYTKEDMQAFLSNILKEPTIYLRYLSLLEINIDVFSSGDDPQIKEFCDYFHEQFPRTTIVLKKIVSTNPVQSVIYSNEIFYLQQLLDLHPKMFTNIDKLGPLYFYCFNQNLEVDELILKMLPEEYLVQLFMNENEFGQNVFHVSTFGITPFIHGIELLLKYGISKLKVDAMKKLLIKKDRNNYTPLHGIVRLFHPNLMELLKENELIPTNFGLYSYALHEMCTKLPMIRFVNFEKSMKILSEFDDQFENIHILVAFNKKGMEKTFQKYFKNLVLKNFESGKKIDTLFKGTTETYWAVINERYDYLEIFLKYGCNLSYNFNGDFTYLHLAIAKKSEKLIQFLLKNTKNILNKRNKFGDTVFHIVCRNRDMRLFNILLNEKDLDINCQTSWGYTAANIASSQGNNELKEILKSHNCIEYPSIFEIMPIEVIRKIVLFIFDFSTTDDVSNLMASCQRWNNLINSKDLWVDYSKIRFQSETLIETHSSFWERHSKWILANGIDRNRIFFLNCPGNRINTASLRVLYAEKYLKRFPKSKRKNPIFEMISDIDTYAILKKFLYEHLNFDMFIQGFMSCFERTFIDSQGIEMPKLTGNFFWDNNFTLAAQMEDKICILDFKNFIK